MTAVMMPSLSMISPLKLTHFIHVHIDVLHQLTFRSQFMIPTISDKFGRFEAFDVLQQSAPLYTSFAFDSHAVLAGAAAAASEAGTPELYGFNILFTLHRAGHHFSFNVWSLRAHSCVHFR